MAIFVISRLYTIKMLGLLIILPVLLQVLVQLIGPGICAAASNSEMVEDGSFLKMNNLAVTFRMPKNILKAWKIKDLALTYTINNVFCLTNYSGYDPEVRSGSSVNNRILPGSPISRLIRMPGLIFSLNFKY